jgi:cytochrome P450
MAAVAGSVVSGAAPWSVHDPYTDEALLDWPGYRQLRDAGPAVWLPKYEMFALTRYHSVRRALEDGESFVSRNGVMMNDRMNQVLRGNTLCSDGAEHDARAIVFYGAANRDERKYPDPDRFDVLRRPGDHLGFGAGPHACVGMNLARMEMLALFSALAKQVRRFTIPEQEPLLNNVLRGFKTLRVAVS